MVSQPSKKFKFYVPCLPSNIILNDEYAYKFVQNINSYNTYEKTFTFLNELSKKNIPCKPIKKIVEDNFVVGFITETNQFVPIIPEKYEKKKKALYEVDLN